ncbi:MAG: formylglycine-generating enzyme family protein [Alphaproteobacteria bacterium]|nr:formylglycine-generating enzyme family protein [Alphaproteobacteria bacterium]
MAAVAHALIALLLVALPAAAQQTFRDCADCPEIVVIPAGTFVMGAPDDEPDRQRWDGPPTKITIAKPFALATYETTRHQYAAFMRESRHRTPGPCRIFTGTWGPSDQSDWQRVNFAQGDGHPQVCVDWYDALAFVEWLNTKGGHSYYLPSEAEFEYANRAGSQKTFPWGNDRAEICNHANVADKRVKDRHPQVEAHDCDDGFEFSAPVGSFPANAFGLHDTFGNVWEWVFDCWAFDHTLSDGTARPVTSGENCHKRIIKGTGYESVARYARSAARGRDDIPDFRIAVIGFRVAARLEVEGDDR